MRKKLSLLKYYEFKSWTGPLVIVPRGQTHHQSQKYKIYMQNVCTQNPARAVWLPVCDVIWNLLLKSEINYFLGNYKTEYHFISKSKFYLSTD